MVFSCTKPVNTIEPPLASGRVIRTHDFLLRLVSLLSESNSVRVVRDSINEKHFRSVLSSTPIRRGQIKIK